MPNEVREGLMGLMLESGLGHDETLEELCDHIFSYFKSVIPEDRAIEEIIQKYTQAIAQPHGATTETEFYYKHSVGELARLIRSELLKKLGGDR